MVPGHSRIASSQSESERVSCADRRGPSAAGRLSTHRLLQRVELRLQLCEACELQVEVTTVIRDLSAKVVDHFPKAAIFSSFAPEHLLVLCQRKPDASGACHRVQTTVAQLDAWFARCQGIGADCWKSLGSARRLIDNQGSVSLRRVHGRIRFFSIQEVRQCSDDLLAAAEPSIHIENRRCIAVDELAWQREQREFMSYRIFVDRIFHEGPSADFERIGTAAASLCETAQPDGALPATLTLSTTRIDNLKGWIP